MKASNPIEKTTYQYVEKLLKDQLPEGMLYHDLEHTLSVLKYTQNFGEQLQLTRKELEILYLAALLHDTGYVKVYEGHESASVEIAKELLQSQSYPPTDIQKVAELIEATIPQQEPRNLMEQIIKDADLNNVGHADFIEVGENLRREWAKHLNVHFNDQQWHQDSLDFLQQHRYYTQPAQQLFGSQKKKNVKTVKKLLKKESKSMNKKKDSGTISGSRSAQMMFKTSLRNHIDLTNIADNKANMMLSINAIVISISIPLLASSVRENMYLLTPAACLLITCVLSIIYATLATRPIKMNGLTNFDQIQSGNTNLFFFGNFYNLPIAKYKTGIKEVMQREELLEATIVNDLYYLGKALGNKYNQLRICYGIFMIGITLTVVSFAVSFFLSLNGGG